MAKINSELCEIVKIYEDPQINFDQIISYIEILKQHDTDCEPYYCEWLDPIILDDLVIETEKKEDLEPNTKIGNFTTFNFIKVPKVI